MDIAEEVGKATIFYNEKCVDADLVNGIVYTENTETGVKKEYKADVVFAADGAFSAVRYNAMQKLERFVPSGFAGSKISRYPSSINR